MKILFVIGQSQYDSTAVFMQEMAERMSDMGHQISMLDGRDVEGYPQKRAKLVSQSYDVVFTINGMLLEEESGLGRELLRDENILYCTYLMDHPLHHRERLMSCYPRIFVLSPDRKHVNYTDQYLKNIWGTAFLPHAGCIGGTDIPYVDRAIDISFMGSYTPPELVWEEFHKYPEKIQQIMEITADLLRENSELTLEQALFQILERYEIVLQQENVAAFLSGFKIVDRYIRCFYRDQVIRTLIDAGICVDVYGDGWEQFSIANTDVLRIHKAVSYQESLDIISRSKISLNIMPWFKDGAHDRVFTAMLCGAVCLTDGSVWLEEQLREEENVYFYSLKGLKYLPAKVRRILSDSEKSAIVAENGRDLARRQHRWANRAEEIVDYLEQLLEIKKQEVLADAEEKNDRGSLADGCEEDSFYPEIIQGNLRLLHLISKVVRHFRTQEYLYAMRGTTEIIDQFQEVIPAYLKWKDVINQNGDIIDQDVLLATLQELLEAQQKQDYVWLADILELRVIPFIISMQEMYAGIKEIEEKLQQGYRLEFTSSGEYTVAVNKEGDWKYLHTNGKPYEEGRLLAESWFDGEHFEYVVYGLGLGYHIIALLQIDEAVRVRVLEADPYIIQLARDFGGICEWEDTGRLEIISDPDFTKLVHMAENFGEKEQFVIHYPSMELVKNEHYHEQLEHYFIEYSSAQTQRIRLQGNFLQNQKYFGHEVTELKTQFAGKTVFLIAAGPSLDQNMMDLKHVSADHIILATGTVLKKLLQAGIQPDYVIITDGGASTYPQTKGLEETGIPLLYLSTVYHSILAEYPGEKYLICQRGFDQSEQYAKEQGYSLYETGGSVMTTALDVCISLGCKRIVFVGLDLAYTRNRDHATDTVYSRTVKDGNLVVTDIYGKPVPTAKNLNLYRKWIERRICREDAAELEFVDATEGGARIKGTHIRKLKEMI